MYRKIFHFSYAMNYVFQVAVSMLTPAALWIGLGWLLHHRWNVGKWSMIVCILLGVISGVVSMFRFLMTSARMIDPMAADQKGDKGQNETL